MTSLKFPSLGDWLHVEFALSGILITKPYIFGLWSFGINIIILKKTILVINAYSKVLRTNSYSAISWKYKLLTIDEEVSDSWHN